MDLKKLKEEEKYIENFISNLSDEEFIEMLRECGGNINYDTEDNYETSIQM